MGKRSAPKANGKRKAAPPAKKPATKKSKKEPTKKLIIKIGNRSGTSRKAAKDAKKKMKKMAESEEDSDEDSEEEDSEEESSEEESSDDDEDSSGDDEDSSEEEDTSTDEEDDDDDGDEDYEDDSEEEESSDSDFEMPGKRKTKALLKVKFTGKKDASSLDHSFYAQKLVGMKFKGHTAIMSSFSAEIVSFRILPIKRGKTIEESDILFRLKYADKLEEELDASQLARLGKFNYNIRYAGLLRVN